MLALLLAPLATAQDLFRDAYVELVGVSDAVASGQQTYTLTVVALDTDGTPLSDLEVRTATQADELHPIKAFMTSAQPEVWGTVGPLVEVQPGLFTIDWSPPSLDTAQALPVTLRGKTAEGQKIVRSWTIPVTPPVSIGSSMKVSPSPFVLEKTETATIEFTVEGLENSDTSLVITSNLGTLEEPVAVSEGKWSARWTPPDRLDHPDVAMFAAVDQRAPFETPRAVAVPLHATVDVRVPTRSGNTVVLDVGGQTVGPLESERGRVETSIVLAPGVREVQATITDSKNETEEKTVDLRVPETERLFWMTPPADLTSDPAVTLPLHLFAVTPEGEPLTDSSDLAVTAEEGTVTRVAHHADGIHRVDYTGPLLLDRSTDTLTATIGEDGPEVELELSLLATRPAKVLAQGRDDSVRVDLTAMDGSPLPRPALRISASGAKTGEVVAEGDHLVFDVTGSPNARFTITPEPTGSRNPVVSLALSTTSTRVLADPLGDEVITAIPLDAMGEPVAGVDVTFEILTHNAQLPAKSKTGESGMTQVHLTPGDEPGLVGVRIGAGGIDRELWFLQLPAEAAPELLELPNPQTPAQKLADEAWAGQTVRVEL